MGDWFIPMQSRHKPLVDTKTPLDSKLTSFRASPQSSQVSESFTCTDTHVNSAKPQSLFWLRNASSSLEAFDCLFGLIYPPTCVPPITVMKSAWQSKNDSPNPKMHLFHILQCTIQNRNVHTRISVLTGTPWDMGQVHCGICEIDTWEA